MAQIKWMKEEVDNRPVFCCCVENIKVEITKDKYISKDWKIMFYKVDDETYYKEWRMPQIKIIRKMGVIKIEKEVISYMQKLAEEHLKFLD